jgi:hypothetical protein
MIGQLFWAIGNLSGVIAAHWQVGVSLNKSSKIYGELSDPKILPHVSPLTRLLMGRLSLLGRHAGIGPARFAECIS